MDEFEKMLEGSPYLFTDGCDIASEVGKVIRVQKDISRRLTVVFNEIQKSGLVDLRDKTQTTEIFESNAIEGAGLSFRGTVDVLNSKLSARAVSLVREGMLLNSITAERKILDVLGMRAAKDLASRLASDKFDQIIESDIRSLHALLTSHETFSGAYRDGHVAISQAEHTPPHPVEVPRMMREMVDWTNSVSERVPVILRAATMHGWFTHVHPFDDGNGRVARLLVNMLMAQSGLPPVIVRHQADRAIYIDALAQSDKAGDILPFAGVFVATLKRYMRQVEKPSFIRQIFHDELRSRGHSLFEHWISSANAFIDALVVNLTTRRMDVQRVGEIDRTSFELIRDGDSDGNVWFLKIVSPDNRELLIWYGYSSWETARVTIGRKKLPAMYFSVRNDDHRLVPYRRVNRSELEGLHEIVVVPDVPVKVHCVVDRLLTGSIQSAADYVAEIIARAFSRGEIPGRPNISK